MTLDFNIEGMLAALDRCAVQVAGDGKRKALRAGGAVVQRAMYLRAPLLSKKNAGSTALEPGALRDGIRTFVHDVDGEAEALVGPAAKVERVARWVEYGHRQVRGGYSKVTANGKTRGPGTANEVDVPAHPFLRPAFEESAGEAVEAEAASLAQTIQEQLR